MDQDTKRVLSVAAGGLLGVISAMVPSWSHESNRAKCIPLAFSEITQIENEAKAQGKEIGPMTRYLTETNDVVMKVLESWNNANLGSSRSLDKRFASELNKKMQNAEGHHYGLKDLLVRIPKDAQDSLTQMTPLLEYKSKMSAVEQNLNDSWSESHRDVDHVEFYTTTDSKGHTQTHMRTVYDYTIHTYDYNKTTGEAAWKNLSFVMPKVGEINPERNIGIFGFEELPVASKTNKEGEEAAQISRKNEGKDGKLTQGELISISRIWRDGSTYQVNMPGVYSSWSSLQSEAPTFGNAKNTAKSASYRTYSHSDSGPAEYQLTRQLIENADRFVSSGNKIEQSLRQTQEKIPKLQSDIESIITNEGSSSKMKEIMAETKGIYSTNFQNGLEVEQFRPWHIVLWSLGGLIAGGLIGAGVGYVLSIGED